jgi:hypothetical protein
MPANTNLGLSAPLVASLVGAYSTWALRWHTYVFLRLVSWPAWVMLMSQLPFGSRYSIKIGTCLALYFGSTLFLRQRPSSPPTTIRRALVFASGFYDPSTLLISRLNLLINMLCVLGCLDFVYRIHYLHSAHALIFCRTGEMTATSAKLLCRNPQSDFMTVSFCHPDGGCCDQHAISREETDHTAIFEITGLTPHTLYLYSASNGHSGSFKTPGQEDDMVKFTLISSSCMKPNWPYNPFNHPLRIQGLEDLGSYLSASRQIPEMMLFLGDFICELPLKIAAKCKIRIYPCSWGDTRPTTIPSCIARYTHRLLGRRIYVMSLGYTCLTITKSSTIMHPQEQKQINIMKRYSRFIITRWQSTPVGSTRSKNRISHSTSAKYRSLCSTTGHTGLHSRNDNTRTRQVDGESGPCSVIAKCIISGHGRPERAPSTNGS